MTTVTERSQKQAFCYRLQYNRAMNYYANPYYVGAWPYIGQAPAAPVPPNQQEFEARARWDSLRRAYQALLELLVAKRVITHNEMLALLQYPVY